MGFPRVGDADRLARHESGRRTMAHVADHLSISALEEAYRSCRDLTAARHVQTIWLLAKGHQIAAVSASPALGGASPGPLQRPGSAGFGRFALPERNEPLRS